MYSEPSPKKSCAEGKGPSGCQVVVLLAGGSSFNGKVRSEASQTPPSNLEVGNLGYEDVVCANVPGPTTIVAEVKVDGIGYT